ncbi:uncharacterized protein LOC110716553 [Chenopodium quinoa]|uniref:uncharacterized protein LOC110696268 n=1 Tax=Chenopodium quinoa TaxID=63459 RepID=UPI000B76CB2D|nr:uncharacterized protein LOC110696268 [Chenopodium quinoa]XP_021750875.1 uncharacterized protein LOC110716553 [Chenopodium quinoa]
MAANPHTSEMVAQETNSIQQLKYWRSVQESIYKQKSRIDWVQLGGPNTKYFFCMMKHRQARNRIDTILTDQHVLLKKLADVEREVVGFYKKFMGSSSPSLEAIDLLTMRNGRQLSVDSQNILIALITVSEIDSAIQRIYDEKAPGL